MKLFTVEMMLNIEYIVILALNFVLNNFKKSHLKSGNHIKIFRRRQQLYKRFQTILQKQIWNSVVLFMIKQ